MFLYYHHTDKKGKWDLEMFDVEAAFLNADLDKQVFIEWPQGMQELGFITEEDKKTKCIELTKAMYGNIDSPLRWMKKSKYLMEQLKMIQSKTDPCIFNKEKNGKVVLIIALYVDDTLCLGIREELDRMYKEIQKKIQDRKAMKTQAPRNMPDYSGSTYNIIIEWEMGRQQVNLSKILQRMIQ